MTRNHCRFVAWILVACVCMGLVVASRMPPSPGVTEGNFDRLTEGMSRREVEEMFGGSPEGIGNRHPAENPGHRYWRGIDGGAIVWFDKDGQDGKIVWKQWHDTAPTTLRGKAHRWLREQF